LAAHARLRALTALSETPVKPSQKGAQTKPLDNEERLEQLKALWQTACASAFETLLPLQRTDNGAPVSRAALGRAMQVEPWHIGLTNWDDDDQDEEDAPEEDKLRRVSTNDAKRDMSWGE